MGNNKKPPWFKVWTGGFDFIKDYDLNDNFYQIIGEAFCNALIYSNDRKKEHRCKNMLAELIFKELKKNIDIAYKEYERQQENGRKGGLMGKGGAPIGNQNAKKKTEPTNNQVSKEATENDDDFMTKFRSDLYKKQEDRD